MSTALTALFGEHPDVRIIGFLAGHATFDYNITDLARNAGVSRPTAYKVVERLVARGVLVRTRRVGASWFYALNAESPLAQSVLAMRDVAVAPRSGSVRRGQPAREVAP